jgi:hypothetical protein
MSDLVPIVMFGWIPLVLAGFRLLPARKAVIASYVVAWLFLPVVSYPIPGFVDYDKSSATNIGVLLGVILLDAGRLTRLRWIALDWWIVAYCVSPFLSSISNDLGPYDGLSRILEFTVSWGIPYLLGRLYFSDLEGVGALAVGIAAGGLVYVPFCLWEIRMSPQLHATFYGFTQHAFDQAMRGGGYRPMVFMQHPLAVGLWMSTATLVALVLWRKSGRRRILGVPMSLAVPVLAVTAVLCKCTGATILLLVGLMVIWSGTRLRTAFPVMILLAVPVLYVSVRGSDAWSGRSIVELAESVAPERAASLEVRMEAEDLLAAKARERPLLGWGGWGRNTVIVDEEAGREVITDGMWILVFGMQGVFGLVALLGLLLAPVAAFVRHCPPRTWSDPRVAPGLALAVVVALFMIDNLLNSMINPVFLLAAGGIGAIRLARARRPEPTPAVMRPIAGNAR